MSDGAMPPINLRCECRQNPLGIDVRWPRLSWEMAENRRGTRQTAYQILVASSEDLVRREEADIWDSGRVASGRSFHVDFGGPALRPRQHCHWAVRVWDEEDRATGLATPVWWEMGLLEAEDWQARWIGVADNAAGNDTGDVPKPCRSHLLRKDFEATGPLTGARAYVSGLGCYELWLNGQRVGRDVLTPGWTTYAKRVQYQTYDVTSLLRPGRNVIGAITGNGWWSSGLGFSRGMSQRTTAGSPRIILQLELEHGDGTSHTIVSDATWRAHPSPIVEDTLYHGEVYDARLEQPGWSEPGFDDGVWAAPKILPDPVDVLVAQQTDTIRVTAELPAVAVTQPQPDVTVFDFGQNHAGRPRLKVTGSRGTRLQIRFAEILTADGMLDRRNLGGARATAAYTLKGSGEEVWEPRFTYCGYRYAELTGCPGQPPANALTSCVLHSAVPVAGRFECSDELLNHIQRNILASQRSNMFSVPTDCPQRDERLGWTGDAQAFAPTACWNMDMASFFAKYLRDMRDSQHESGYVHDVAPAVAVRGPAAPGWGDAIVIIPWTLYRFYEDKRVIEENYAAMRAWVDYMKAHALGYLYECEHSQVKDGYGDWIAVVESPKKPIAAAFFYYSTKLLAQMGRIIGRDDDAQEYTTLARHIAEAFNASFFDPQTSHYLGATQSANILPLAFGVTPPEHRPAVLENIVRDIRQREDHLSAGFLGTAYLLPLLSDNGYHDLAYRLATQRTYPSWGYMIECGATAISERWNPDTGNLNMNSWNHFALGAIGQWFYESLAGLNILEPRPRAEDEPHARFLIRPRPAGDLTSASAAYESLHGPLRSAWRREANTLQLDVTIPPNSLARVCVPTGGQANARVFEGETTLLRDGRTEETVDGLRFESFDTEGYAVFTAAAGSYTFRTEF